MTRLIVAFCKFLKAPKKCRRCCSASELRNFAAGSIVCVEFPKVMTCIKHKK
jgi:hypothetical protein